MDSLECFRYSTQTGWIEEAAYHVKQQHLTSLSSLNFNYIEKSTP